MTASATERRLSCNEQSKAEQSKRIRVLPPLEKLALTSNLSATAREMQRLGQVHRNQRR